MKKIIDVSADNGRVHWKEVKEKGVDGAIVKIIREDLKKDEQFDANYKGCHQNRVPWGVYNYTYAATTTKAKHDMRLICDILDQLDKQYFRYGIWFDIEDNLQAKLNKDKIAAIINAAQETVEKRGYTFGVYTGMDYFEEHMDAERIKTKNYWIARYYRGYEEMQLSVNPNENYKPTVVPDLAAWQYTSRGIIGKGVGNGNGGYFDFSVFYHTTLEKTKRIGGDFISTNEHLVV